MAKSKPTDRTTQPTPTTRYGLRNRPTKVTKPATASKRVYRTRNGLVSLLKTPQKFISTVESNSLQSPLLRLPAELRHKVFEYALGGTHIFYRRSSSVSRMYRTTVSVGGTRVPWSFKFALPRVCRQIYHETATLVYSANDFHFQSAYERDQFLGLRKQAQIEAIKTIMLTLSFGRNQTGARYLEWIRRDLKRCKGLQNLYLKYDTWLWGKERTLEFVNETKDAVAEGLAGDIDVYFVEV